MISNFTFQTALKLQMLGSYLGPEPRLGRPERDSQRAERHRQVAFCASRSPTAPSSTATRPASVGADALIGELSRAAIKGRLEAALEPYLQPHVLVIDELGYLSHAVDAANVLYRVVNERYLRHRPMLITTNKPLAALGSVLHDGDLAEAILDRLLEHGAHSSRCARSLVSHSPSHRGGRTHPTHEARLITYDQVTHPLSQAR